MQWRFDRSAIDWGELSELYRIAPLGDKKPNELEVAFAHSMYTCFVLDQGRLIGAGRLLADGIDCAYLGDVAVHPAFQGRGVGGSLITKLTERAAGHRKIILYANPGTEGLYGKLGFKRMRTAMARFKDQEGAIKRGLIAA
jgi:ribosomal protein S18 acetylase RimI-like enzyme